jgi:hypothetical protein
LNIALLGNCQADPLRHMLIFANSNLHVTPFNVNNLRSETEQFDVFQKLREFDLVISQALGKNYHCLSSENIRTKDFKVIFIPNLFFLGWHPDMTYLGDGSNRVIGPSEDLHSLICLLLARAIPSKLLELNDEELEDLYEFGFRKFMELHNSFDASKEILKKRFKASDLSFEFFEEIVGFQESFMFTHNHPMNRAIYGIVRQILDRIKILSRVESKELIDITPNPLANRVTWSPIFPQFGEPGIDLRKRMYYVGKGRFLNNREFIRGEIMALEKLEKIPSIRRPDIPDLVFETLIEYIANLTK